MKEKTTIKEFAGKKVLIVVENLPSPFDRRVWQEATALRDEGAVVSIICPMGKGYMKGYEMIEDITIYRHPLPFEADGPLGYLLEYGMAFLWETVLAWKVLFTRGFDVIHACNPPDLIFLVALPFKLLGKKFLFDHHDINPELYEAKFNRRGFFYKLTLLFERLTFKTAKVCIATNNSYKEIAIRRGGKKGEDIFVVRSGPSLKRLKIIPPLAELKMGREFLVGYVGVIGRQEGLTYLIDACQHIVEENKRTDIHFICVGAGTELENIKKYCEERGVDEYFTFTGRVSDRKLLEALNTSDLCVNPDEFNPMNDKSTMNKIMEYMALAKPIVQFDLAEGRFSAQEASLYAKPNDAIDMAAKILELIDDPALRESMGAFGLNRVKNELEWEYEKENLYAAYRKIFKRTSKK
ncbi:MAG: glycosyltransferase family 4 protein [Candidatus Omnitrophica bacterium]|nr:glycosyltransferase family 4 protein [Candidatus Omnitrophota bacterium]